MLPTNCSPGEIWNDRPFHATCKVIPSEKWAVTLEIGERIDSNRNAQYAGHDHLHTTRPSASAALAWRNFPALTFFCHGLHS